MGGAKGGYLCDSPWGAVEQQEQRAWWRPDTPQQARPATRRAPRRSHQLLHKQTATLQQQEVLVYRNLHLFVIHQTVTEHQFRCSAPSSTLGNVFSACLVFWLHANS